MEETPAPAPAPVDGWASPPEAATPALSPVDGGAASGGGDEAADPAGMYPIAILIEKLRAEDTKLRLLSVRQLNSIDDDDEVLLALAEELGKMVPYVGGEQWAHTLLQPLEALAGVEETVVREKAVESLCLVGKQTAEEHTTSHYIGMLRRLSTGDWFTSRVSSCGLFSVAYAKVTQAETRQQLRASFTLLCHDETPMVRRAAASNLGSLAAQFEPEFLVSDIVPIFTQLANDEQDSVRILVAENCHSIAQLLSSDADAMKYIVPVLRQFGEDKSWRVRYMVVEQLSMLGGAMKSAEIVDELVPIFRRILQDPEAEVRTMAAHHVASFSNSVPQAAVVEQLMELVSALASDPSQHVKAALAPEIMAMAPHLGRELTTAQLLPLHLQLLRDESSEVRLNVISQLEAVSSVIGVAQISHSLLPAVMELAQDKQWRVRLAIIQYMPSLAKQMGQQMFDSELSELCFSWLVDPVYAIREAAVKNLPLLCSAFTEAWSEQNVLPRIIGLYKDQTNYMHRLTAFNAINELLENAAQARLSTELVVDRLLPVVLEGTKDTVANVRFNAAKTIGRLIPYIDASTLTGVIKPRLQELSLEQDVDVKYFAVAAARLCS
jgi:serine/threonine-protein phosphatase 2A regulatory subunit A